jgi:hypothetical protein
MSLRKPLRKLALSAVTLSLALPLSLMTAGVAAAASPTPPFNQCPAIGASPSCAIVVELTDGATNILGDPTVGPFDGIEDTLIGVQNNSSVTVTRITLTDTRTVGIPIFGFDLDGICSGYTFTGSAGCPFGTTGYEGPGTSFENISLDAKSGDVVFNPGVAPGGTAYFSLEDSLTAANIIVSNTAVSYTGPGSVQYSDPLVLKGHLQTAPGGLPIAGENIGFVLGTDTKSAGPTDALGDASAASYNELQTPGSVSQVDVSFAGDTSRTPVLLASNSSSPFSIDKEDCTLTYTGDVLVNAANNTTLSAQFGEPDTTPGDWTGKLITFTVTDVAQIQQTFTAQTDVLGVASTSQALGPNVYSVSVSFIGDDFYLPCATAADTLVTVQAANAKITGGGWISQGTGKTNFGFNVIRDVTGLKGQLQVRVRSGKDKFHSTSVLTLNSSGNSGTWTGTGRWDGVTGYTFTVSVVDNGTSGKKGDTISIVITSPTLVNVFTTGGLQPLKGGNIVVH